MLARGPRDGNPSLLGLRACCLHLAREEQQGARQGKTAGMRRDKKRLDPRSPYIGGRDGAEQPPTLTYILHLVRAGDAYLLGTDSVDRDRGSEFWRPERKIGGRRRQLRRAVRHRVDPEGDRNVMGIIQSSAIHLALPAGAGAGSRSEIERGQKRFKSCRISAPWMGRVTTTVRRSSPKNTCLRFSASRPLPGVASSTFNSSSSLMATSPFDSGRIDGCQRKCRRSHQVGPICSTISWLTGSANVI